MSLPHISISRYRTLVNLRAEDPASFIRFDPSNDNHFQQMHQENNYYFLVSGEMNLTYASNNTSHTISSQYGHGWAEYIDSSIYNQNVSLQISNPYEFFWIKSNTSSESLVPLHIKIGKTANNETIHTTANANSVLFVYGHDFSYNDVSLTKYEVVGAVSNTMNYYQVNILETQNLAIKTANASISFLIEAV